MGRLEAQIRDAEQTALNAEDGSDAKRDAQARVAVLKDLDSKGYGFTQNDVGKSSGQARDEGRSAAENALLKRLGVTDADEAERLVSEYRTIQQATETETEAEKRAREAAERERDAAKTSAEKAEERYKSLLKSSALESALSSKGVRGERLKAAIRNADPSKLSVEGDEEKGYEVKGEDDAAEAVKSDFPEWFGEAKPDPVRETPGGSGGAAQGDNQSYAARSVDRFVGRRKRAG